MTKVSLTAHDLTRVRFAASPVWETTALVSELRRPAGPVSIHARGLARITTPRARALLDLLAPLVRVPGWIPDTLAPTPSTAGSPRDAFEAILQQGPEVAESDLDTLRRHGGRGGWATATAEEFVRHAATALVELWKEVLEPLWDRVEGLVAADLVVRQRDLVDRGLAGTVARLHPGIALDGSVLALPLGGSDCRHASSDRGVWLVPSVIRWDRPSLSVVPEHPVALSYPVIGAATLWETSPQSGLAIDLVLGRSRATILTTVAHPRTTTSLSNQLGLSPATVSTHLTSLREAGLVSRQRAGREVFYVQTELGARLVRTSESCDSTDTCSGC